MRTYVALLRKDPDSDYGVDFPDFLGCITAGSTFEEVAAMTREALELHIEGMFEDGDALPEPSALETVMADPENQDAVPFTVAVSDSGKVLRVDLSADQELLSAAP